MLRLKLKDGEQLVINGAVVRAAGRVDLLIENDAAILRAREIMQPAEAITPARRLYFAVMLAYVEPARRAAEQANILGLMGALMDALEQAQARLDCAQAAYALARGDHYRALGHCRALIDHEDRVMGLADADMRLAPPVMAQG